MASKDEAPEILTIGGHEVRVTHPSKPYFSKGAKVSKIEIVRYYLSVAEGALQGIRDRPIVLKRFVNGAHAPPFYQKRAPETRPAFLRTVTLSFPSGRTAEEIVVDDAAGLAWIVNLGCLELHPHPVRSAELRYPDELRIDLDPGPGVGWEDVRKVALEVKALLEELGLVGYPKTSGSRGMHVNARIEPRWEFADVRRAALAFAREIERRAPQIATAKWWKEERRGVFLDYNQNAKDRTTCSAYSVRPLPDARVSAPLTWDEVVSAEPADFTVFTVPKRFAEIGDPYAKMDETKGSLEAALELAARDESAGVGDAPWPPHYKKMQGEGPRVRPSAKKKVRPKDAANAEGSVASETSEPAEPGPDPDPNAAPIAPKPKKASATGRRKSTMPLVVIAKSGDKDAALAGLERWKTKHPAVATLLAEDDVLVDSMRGRSATWTRIRVNLRNVPVESRPAETTPDPDDEPVHWPSARPTAKPKKEPTDRSSEANQAPVIDTPKD